MSLSASFDSHLERRLPLPAERSHKMLKDFLIEDVNIPRPLRRLASLPRLPLRSPSIRGFTKTNNRSPPLPIDREITLRRSRSKVASMTISAMEAIFKVVRTLPMTLSKHQSSLAIESPNKTRKMEEEPDDSSKVAVRLKDIIRWSSFGDMIEKEEPQSLEELVASSSPKDCTTATTVWTNSTSSSSSLSWYDSDFSSDCSPPWSSNTVTLREQFALDSKSAVSSTPHFEPGSEPVQTVESFLHFSHRQEESIEVHAAWNECKGESPVSVIEYEIGEDGEWRWSFQRSPPHVNISSKQGEREEEECEEDEEPSFSLEDKATGLLNKVRAFASENGISFKCNEERLLLDFFRSELPEGIRFRFDIGSGDEDYGELVRRAESWVRGDGHSGSNYQWGIDGKKDAYLRDMEKGGTWSKFEEDQRRMVVEMESGVWSLLLDELLGDIFALRW
ncbi:hypothetical protein SAY87_020503 [Trapa incisa]|uniref:DUF4378 domain-containing protein n=1 Tax=Trapa incisa TaxID=236973 RepID=A0AAN7JQG2_9MYRT|nr:hypothetical protein SAY87_020503 [Trapa incisa]